MTSLKQLASKNTFGAGKGRKLGFVYFYTKHWRVSGRRERVWEAERGRGWSRGICGAKWAPKSAGIAPDDLWGFFFSFFFFSSLPCILVLIKPKPIRKQLEKRVWFICGGQPASSMKMPGLSPQKKNQKNPNHHHNKNINNKKLPTHPRPISNVKGLLGPERRFNKE